MRVLIIDTDRCGLDFAWRCVEAGHDVRWYNRDKEGNKFKDGHGFPGIEHIDDWRASMKWAKDGLIWLSSNALFLKEMDEWKKHGYPIFAPSQAAADLEIKRVKGMRLLEKMGLLVPSYHTFNSLKEAENFARKSDQAYVFKTMGDNEDKSLSYVAKTPADLVGRIQRWIKLGLNPKGQVMLQEKIDGYEMGVSCWFGPNGPLPDKWNINFEHKKLMPGNYGPNTGEMGCYDAQTEVLTDSGWKFWPDVTLSDQIASLQNGKTEFVKPSEVVSYDYVGPLICWKNQTLDICVTPNHNMYVNRQKAQRDGKDEFEFLRADACTHAQYAIKRTAEWGGLNKPIYSIPGYRYGKGRGFVNAPDIPVSFLSWARFLGLYLAEGSTGSAQVHIAQSHPEKSAKAEKIILETGIPYVRIGNGFLIQRKQLTRHLKPLGTAHEKRVPDYIKNAGLEAISAFLEGYGLGDAHTYPTGYRVFYTCNRLLAGDVQELLLKIGRVGVVKQRNRIGHVSVINGRDIVCTNPQYEVIERVKKTTSWLDARDRTEEMYSGKVYCATVPGHVMYVRRNGKPFWCGNTVIQYCESEKMADELFTPELVKHLISIGQLGDIDLNCIVEKGSGRIYPLEFTCRPGWPYDWIASDLHKGDPVEWMRDLLDGHDTLKVSYDVAIGEVVAIPPFPRDDCDEAECMDLPVQIPHRWDRIHPVCMQIEQGPSMKDDKVVETDIFTTTGNYVLVAVGTGKTVKQAKKAVDKLIKDVNVSNMMVRNDIGDDLEACLPELHQFGFATCMEYDV